MTTKTKTKKSHWTQRPENAARLRRMLRKALKVRRANKAQVREARRMQRDRANGSRATARVPAVLRDARLQVLAALGAEIQIARLEAEIATLRAFLKGGKA